MTITTVTAVNSAIAVRTLRRAVGVFLMVLTISQLAKERKVVPWLYLVFFIYYLGIVYYAYTHILTATYDIGEDRLDDDTLGANTVAYFTFYTTFIIYILAEMVKGSRLRRFLRILFLTMPVWSFYVAILTASRQVFVIQGPLILLLLYVRYLKTSKANTKVFFLIAGIVAMLAIGKVGLDLYERSELKERNEQSLEEDQRMVHFHKAFEVAFEHPLVGVGPGNYGRYVFHRAGFTHSSYLELIATTGFPGLIPFLILIFQPMLVQWKRYRKTRDPGCLVFFLFFVFFAVDNVFYVFYTAPWLMSFFFLVEAHGNQYYKLKFGSQE